MQSGSAAGRPISGDVLRVGAFWPLSIFPNGLLNWQIMSADSEIFDAGIVFRSGLHFIPSFMSYLAITMADPMLAFSVLSIPLGANSSSVSIRHSIVPSLNLGHRINDRESSPRNYVFNLSRQGDGLCALGVADHNVAVANNVVHSISTGI